MTLWRLVLQEYRIELTGLAIASLISAAAGVAIIAFINSSLIVADGEPLTILWQFVGLLVLLFVLSFVSQYSLSVIGHKFVYEFRNNLIKRLMDTDIAIIEKIGSSRILASLSKDILNVQSAFMNAPSFIQSSILVIGAFFYLGYLSFNLLLIVMLLILSIAIVGVFLVKQVYRQYNIVRNSEDDLYKNFEDIIYGRKELSLNRHRAKILYENDYLSTADKIRRHIIKGDTYHLMALNWTDVMVLASIGMVFYLSNVLGWADTITATTFAITILFLKSPLIQSFGMIPVLIDAHVSFKKVLELELDKTDDIQLNNQHVDFGITPVYNNLNPTYTPIKIFDSTQTLGNKWQTIELQDIYYQYLDAQGQPSFAIGPINFTLNRGDVVFLIGGNGSGKSTFAKIITGLYRPDSGRILVDGTTVIDEMDEEVLSSKASNKNTATATNTVSEREQTNSIGNYRQLYSAIYTDMHLFKTVIGQHDKLITEEKTLMEEWLSLLQMQHKLKITDLGKVLNEDLSQGQKKRLAMLLAVMEQRDLLLLDEWAADQDPQYRRIFYFDIIPKLKAMGKTLIVISHDDHYFEQADRLLQMKNGQLHELTGEERITASRDAVAQINHIEG